MSWLSDMFGGKEGKYETKDLLDPQQRSLYNSIGSYYNNAMSSGGFPQYTGNYTAPMNQAETKAIGNMGNLADTFAGWRKDFTPGQLNPEVEATELASLNNQFYGAGNQPGSKALTEEQFAGTGGYWGDARAKGVMGNYWDTVTDQYNKGRSTRLQNSYKNALDYGTTGTAINQANIEAQAIPRLIQQYGLDQTYKEWLRTRPESADNMRNALSFIDLTTTAQEYKPGSNSSWGTLGSLLGGAAGLIAAPLTAGASIPLASSIGRRIGGLFDNNQSNGTSASSNSNLLSLLNSNSNSDWLKSLTSANVSKGNMYNAWWNQ